MPRAMFEYWLKVKTKIMNQILKIIEDNKNIKDEVLIARLHIESPFLEREKSMEIIQDLKMTGKIKVNSEGEITLCQ